MFFGDGAPAATLIECTEADGRVVVRLLISGRRATDVPGKGWLMFYREQTYPGGPFGATASTRRNGAIEIKVHQATSATGPAGKILRFSGHPTRPTLSEFNVGGFVGDLKLGDFACTRRVRYCGPLLEVSAK